MNIAGKLHPKLAQTTEVIVFKFALFYFLSRQRPQKRHEPDNCLDTNGFFDALKSVHFILAQFGTSVEFRPLSF